MKGTFVWEVRLQESYPRGDLDAKVREKHTIFWQDKERSIDWGSVWDSFSYLFFNVASQTSLAVNKLLVWNGSVCDWLKMYSDCRSSKTLNFSVFFLNF